MMRLRTTALGYRKTEKEIGNENSHYHVE